MTITSIPTPAPAHSTNSSHNPTLTRCPLTRMTIVADIDPRSTDIRWLFDSLQQDAPFNGLQVHTMACGDMLDVATELRQHIHRLHAMTEQLFERCAGD